MAELLDSLSPHEYQDWEFRHGSGSFLSRMPIMLPVIRVLL